MRGTKLTAWQIPPIWKNLRDKSLSAPAGSNVLAAQEKLLKATLAALEAIAEDMRVGLLETVGVESFLVVGAERSSIVLTLPADADAAYIARAVDAENIEAWLDETGRVNIAVNPWFSTKDVDQAVLCTIKVIHVLLGIHATDNLPPLTFAQKIRASIADILTIQKESTGGKK